MIQAYIIKPNKAEPFYSSVNDILYSTLDKAREASKEWDKPNDVYYLLIELTDLDQILRSIWSAANGQGNRITSYKILETIIVRKEC